MKFKISHLARLQSFHALLGAKKATKQSNPPLVNRNSLSVVHTCRKTPTRLWHPATSIQQALDDDDSDDDENDYSDYNDDDG